MASATPRTRETDEPPVVCPITLEPPVTPVTTPCGHTFERDALEHGRAQSSQCPLCRAVIPNAHQPFFGLAVNASLRALLESWGDLRQHVQTLERRQNLPAMVVSDVHIIPGRPLGRGAHGVVKRGKFGEVLVAVKMVDASDAGAARTIVRELELLRQLHHPHVIQLIGSIDNEDEGQVWAVLEFADHGSLEQLLQPGSGDLRRAALGDEGALPGVTPASLRLVHEVSAALAYLHRMGVAHGDLKPGNVLVCAGGRAKVSDFGLARLQTTLRTQGSGSTSRGGGTPEYMAPEQWGAQGAASRALTPASDVYSLGVLVACVTSGVQPFADLANAAAIEAAVLRGERPELPAGPAALRALVQSCWAGPPDERCSSADAQLSLLRLRHTEGDGGGPAQETSRPPPGGSASQASEEQSTRLASALRAQEEAERRAAEAERLATDLAAHLSALGRVPAPPPPPPQPAQPQPGSASAAAGGPVFAATEAQLVSLAAKVGLTAASASATVAALMSLEEANWERKGLHAEDAVAIAHLVAHSTKLSKLDLDYNPGLGQAGFDLVARALAVSTSLKILYLRNNEIVDVSRLGAALEVNKTLKKLWLNSNEIVDVSRLGAALEVNKTLKKLWLNSNEIVDVSRLGAALEVNKTLKKLWLNSNEIVDVSRLGAALEVNQTLKVLYLNHNQLSDASKASLRAAWGTRVSLIL